MGTTPKTMCTNIGGMERMLRIVAGIAILYFTMAGAIPMPWGAYWSRAYSNRSIGLVPTVYSFWN